MPTGMKKKRPSAFKAPSKRRGRRYGGRIVGLLGGSFNPAHEGHRHISLEALKRLGLDEVWWMVSPQNPLKSAEEMASFDNRLARAEVVADHPRIHVTGIETLLGTTYTADTLNALKRRFPDICFVWLMGADNLIQIPKWRDWNRIFMEVPIAIFARSSYDSRALFGLAARRYARARVPQNRARTLAGLKPPAWVFLAIRRHPASATAIRAKERNRK